MLPAIYADNIEKATSGTVVVKTQSKRTIDEADDDDGIVLVIKAVSERLINHIMKLIR